MNSKYFDKLIKVIASCETKDQMLSARRIITNNMSNMSDADLMKICLFYEIRKEVLNQDLKNDAFNYESLGNDMYDSGIYNVSEVMYRAGIEKIQEYNKEV